jgi:hypothetical protein
MDAPCVPVHAIGDAVLVRPRQGGAGCTASV